jgi:hypothetical protein
MQDRQKIKAEAEQAARMNLWNNPDKLSAEQIQIRLKSAQDMGMSPQEITGLSEYLYSKSNVTQPLQGLASYVPVASRDMMDSYNMYMDLAREESPALSNVTEDFSKAAPTYQEYDWQNMRPVYDANAPKMEAFDFTAPQIDAVQDLSGLPKEIRDEIAQSEEERTRAGFKGQREQVMDYIARIGGGGRRGAAAATLAKLGSQEEQSVDSARQQARLQQAMQELQLAQGTQSLTANRATTQAGLEQSAQAQQASEKARIQNSAMDEAKYKTGLEQAYQEAQAGEKEKSYQANYGRAQDISGLTLSEQQQRQADLNARRQAALAGAQTAQGMVSQAGTYDIQKNSQRKSSEEATLADIYNISATAGTAGGYGAGGGFSSTTKPNTTMSRPIAVTQKRQQNQNQGVANG